MADDPSGLELIRQFFGAAKGTVDLYKALTEVLPDSESAERLSKGIETAENALRVSEAQLAQAFGYKLCQCTFPPQIMLSVGHHETYGEELFECSGCGKRLPTEMQMEEAERNKYFRGGTTSRRR